MGIHFNLFNVVLLFGVVQGIIISLTLLLPGKDSQQSKYFLASFLLVLTYNSFGTFCWSSGLSLQWFYLFDRSFPYTFIFTAGPSLYLYIRTITSAEKISAKDIIKSYLPAVADLGLRLTLLIYASWNTGTDIRKIEGFYHPSALIMMVVIFWAYLLSAIRLFRPSLLQTPVHTSPTQEQNRVAGWTKSFLAVLAGIALLWALTIFGTVMFGFRTLAYFQPIEIVLVIFVYWIGLRSYHCARVVYINAQNAAKAYVEKLTTEEAEAYIKLLKKAMEVDRLYLDAELSVNKLADTLGLNAKLVSAVLNGHLNKGFNTFVNEYRVNAVKQQLLQPAYAHLTNLGIALNCGFKSEATFHRVFKELIGISPSKFRKNNCQYTLDSIT
jgi:AraC-like DNA-binding protein